MRVHRPDRPSITALNTARDTTRPPRSPKLRAKDRPIAVRAKVPARAPDRKGSRSAAANSMHVKSLLCVTTDLVFLVDRAGAILESHVPPDNDLLIPSDSLAGKPLAELLSSAMAGVAFDNISKALDSGETQIFCTPHLLPGRIRQIEARVTPNGSDQVLVLLVPRFT